MAVKGLKLGLCALAMATSVAAEAGEVSLVSGLYQKEESKNKKSDTDLGGSSTISIGGRYATYRGDNIDLFYLASLGMTNYDAPKGVDEPSGTNSFALGGGLRYYFTENAGASLVPFAEGVVLYRNEKKADRLDTSGYTMSETNGLFYGAAVGLRANFGQRYFLDVSVPLFESALFGKTKSTTYDAKGDVQDEVEKSKTELYVKSDGALNGAIVGLGMKI